MNCLFIFVYTIAEQSAIIVSDVYLLFNIWNRSIPIYHPRSMRTVMGLILFSLQCVLSGTYTEPLKERNDVRKINSI